MAFWRGNSICKCVLKFLPLLDLQYSSWIFIVWKRIIRMRASRQARKPVVTLKSSSIAFVNSQTREIEICNEETVQKDNSQHFAAKCCFCKSYKLIIGRNVFDNYNNRLLSYHVPPCCLRKRRWMKYFNLHYFHGTLVTFFFSDLGGKSYDF